MFFYSPFQAPFLVHPFGGHFGGQVGLHPLQLCCRCRYCMKLFSSENECTSEGTHHEWGCPRFSSGAACSFAHSSVRMYHGTTREAAAAIIAGGFRKSTAGMLGAGVYVSRDRNKAACYPLHLPSHERVVLELQVNVGNVIVIDRQDHPRRSDWSQHGYDTAWVPPNCGMVPSGREEACIWDTSRITVIWTPLQLS